MTADFFRRSEPLSRSFRSSGGLATVTVGGANPKRAETVTAQVRGIFEDLERELSTYQSDSAVSLLVKNAGVNPVVVSEDACRVLNLAHHFGQFS
jgi:thiamine biosynthesis lipoprotein ApbE